MGKYRVIFYSIFAFYQLMSFGYTLVIDADASILFKSAGYVSVFKYLTFFGVVLILVDFVWAWRHDRKAKNDAEELRLENNTLKARLYDYQESKNQDPSRPDS